MADAALARELTLSVVSHRHGALLHLLLDDLAGHAPLRGVRVVVTLNVPEELDTARWPALQLVVLRNKRPQGFGANHNAAFDHCATHWYAVLNPDLRLPENPFQALVAAATAQPGTGVVAPVITDSSGRPEDSVRENLTPTSLLRRTLQRSAGHRRLPGLDLAAGGNRFFWLAGMFLLFSSDAYRHVGGFDERLFLYCEDYDICARLRRAGYGLAVEPRSTAVHEAQRNSQRSWQHLRWHLGSLLRVWTSSAFWWVLRHGHRHGGP